MRGDEGSDQEVMRVDVIGSRCVLCDRPVYRRWSEVQFELLTLVVINIPLRFVDGEEDERVKEEIGINGRGSQKRKGAY